MEAGKHNDITKLLVSAQKEGGSITEQLLPLVYDELRKLAEHRMANEPPGLTLQATALVHEAYMRLVGNTEIQWDSRGHFFSAAAIAMRRILVERARRVGSKKHGGDRCRVPLEQAEIQINEPDEDVLALDEALEKLEQFDARKNRVVMLRYFAGLTVEEVSQVLGVSYATVKNDWQFAKAWLYKEIRRDD